MLSENTSGMNAVIRAAVAQCCKGVMDMWHHHGTHAHAKSIDDCSGRISAGRV